MKKHPTPSQPYWKKNNALHFAAGLILSLTLVIMAFEWNFPHELTDRPIEFERETLIDQPEMIAVSLPTPPRPKVPVHVVPVPDDTPISTKKDAAEPEPVIDLTDEPAPNLGDLLAGDAPVDKAAEVEKYDVIPAVPQGGMDAFYSYLYKHIRYPEHLKGRNVSGKVYVSFEIDEQGRVTNVQILKGFDKQLEKEIIRVLSKAPQWEPAQQGNQKVRTRHQIPFSFNLE